MLTAGSKYWWLVKGVAKLPPGEAFIAEHNAAFTCTPETFRNTLYQVAKTAGKQWHVSACVVGSTVVWAFYKGSDYMRPNLPAYPIVKKLRAE